MSEALTEVFHSFMFPFDQIPADPRGGSRAGLQSVTGDVTSSTAD